jgi:hypothetical protein
MHHYYPIKCRKIAVRKRLQNAAFLRNGIADANLRTRRTKHRGDVRPHAKQFKRHQRQLRFLRARLGRLTRDIGRKIAGQPQLEAVFRWPR